MIFPIFCRSEAVGKHSATGGGATAHSGGGEGVRGIPFLGLQSRRRVYVKYFSKVVLYRRVPVSGMDAATTCRTDDANTVDFFTNL